MPLATFDFSLFSNLLCIHCEQDYDGLLLLKGYDIFRTMSKVLGSDPTAPDSFDILQASINLGIIEYCAGNYCLSSTVFQEWRAKQ